MAEPESDRLDAFVEECLAALEKEGDSALERLCALHPEEAAILRRRIDSLRELGLVRTAGSEQPERIPERFGDFRLIERLGAGGMGVVYRARQESLGREVALKLVRPEQLYFPQAKARFHREVQTIARLQHPSIVPIYSVGEESGTPWFAMELLRGAALSRVVEHFKGRSAAQLTGADFAAAVAEIARDPESGPELAAGCWLFAGSWSDACVRIVRQVADALAHAHGRGVLHRDLKPSNIVVTPGGRVVLLDFGLASSRTEDELTRTGAMLGSMPYLSPEQARGDVHAVGERSDVYSLGVTLYELLCLALPYAKPSHTALLAAIEEGRPPSPRRLNPALHRDVETVCLVAMEPAPARRYASAADFARDLDRVLARRPIDARRPGPHVRFARWVQREPATAAAVALAALLVLGGPGAYGWLRRRADRDLKVVAAAGDERRFRQALSTIDALTEPLWDDDVEDLGGTSKFKSAVLDRALALYADFTPEQKRDPEFVRKLGTATRQVGEMRSAIGDGDAARRQYERSIEILEPLEREKPVAPQVVEELADARRRLAMWHACRGEGDVALPLFKSAIAAVEALPPDAEPPFPRAMLVTGAQCGAGLLQISRGDLDGGEALCRRAIATLRELESRAPDSIAVTGQLARACAMLGRGLTFAFGRGADAEALLREAVERFDRLAKDETLGPLWLAKAAETRATHGEVLHALSRPADALESSRRAVVDLDALLLRFPENVAFRRNLAAALGQAAEDEFELGMLTEARRDRERSLAMHRDELAADPTRDRAQLNVASGEYQLARILRARGEVAAARALVERSAAWMEAASQRVGSEKFATTARTWRWELAACDAELGDDERLVPEIDALLAGPQRSGDWSRAIRTLARGAAVVRTDESLGDGEQDERAGPVEDALLRVLKEARRRGVRFDELEGDPSLATLARRAELRAQLRELGLVKGSSSE